MANHHHPYQNIGDNGSYASMQDMYPPYRNGNNASPYQQQQQQYQPELGYNNYGQQQSSYGGNSPYAGGSGSTNGYGNNNNDSNAYLPSKEAYGGAGADAAASSSRQQDQSYYNSSSFDDGIKYPAANATSGGSSKKKWILGTLIVLVLAGIGGGIAAWKIIEKNNNDSSSSSSVSSTSKNGGNSTSGGISGDPSSFKKDSNLKQSFYAMAYSPTGSILPNCGANLAEVQRDMQLLSQLTTRIRTYGSDCNASELVMQAISDTKVDMTVWLGIYIDSDESIWRRQRDATLAIISKYGTDHISGITVGNEFLLNTNGAASSYTSIRNKVAEFKTELEKLNLDKTIPVGTADAGSMITASLASNVDYVMANVHPWFGGVPIDQAAGWTWNWQEENVVSVAGNTPTYIAETGWPTESMTAANATLGGAVAGVPQLQTFLDTYVCQANANQSAYFYFEPFDEPWKEVFGGVEPYWGLFDKDRNLKDITIPDCKPGNY